MENRIVRKLFLGFISIHILYHAQTEPFYGSWMIEELKHHGYAMSAGTLYPILHSMEAAGLLQYDKRNVGGKVRKYYEITSSGASILAEAKSRASELMNEISGDMGEKA